MVAATINPSMPVLIMRPSGKEGSMQVYIHGVTFRVTTIMPEDTAAVDRLVSLGFTSYEAKVYASLVSLGVGSVSEIHRNSRVPRTKVYETLDELIRQGAVELQAGRPALYRAVRPKVLVKRLTEDFVESAEEVGDILERSYQDARPIESDLAWTVRGSLAIRKKLAEIVSSAKVNVRMIETYPPSNMLAVSGLLKTLKQRGVEVTAISVLRENQPVEEYKESGLIEYRVLQGRPSSGTVGVLDEDILKPILETLSSPYGVAVADSARAFVIVPNPNDESRSVGLAAQIPGVPTILGLTIPRYVAALTKKIRV